MTQYNRHAVAPLDVIISAINAGWDDSKASMTFENWKFNIHSLRLKTFCRDANENRLYCSCCGLKAEFFAVESFLRGSPNSVHVNLYGRREDGTEVLFTHDHTKARSLGGKDSLENVTTMCFTCNNKKAEGETREVNSRRASKDYTPGQIAFQEKLLEAKKNPAAADVVETSLNSWAANLTTKQFTQRLDTHLQLFGWKRRQLKEKINEGVINFTLHPVRDQL